MILVAGTISKVYQEFPVLFFFSFLFFKLRIYENYVLQSAFLSWRAEQCHSVFGKQLFRQFYASLNGLSIWNLLGCYRNSDPNLSVLCCALSFRL